MVFQSFCIFQICKRKLSPLMNFSFSNSSIHSPHFNATTSLASGNLYDRVSFISSIFFHIRENILDFLGDYLPLSGAFCAFSHVLENVPDSFGKILSLSFHFLNAISSEWIKHVIIIFQMQKKCKFMLRKLLVCSFFVTVPNQHKDTF